MNLGYSAGVSRTQNLTYFLSLLKNFAENKNSRQALLLFRSLLGSNVKPNDLTFAWLLKAFTSSSSSSSSSLALNSLKSTIEADQIHTFLIKSGVSHFVYVSTALLDFYMKLGCLQVAHRLFDDMHDRDTVSWNALICGFSRSGYDADALKLFVQMCREGFKPQETTLVSLVPSCGRHEFIFQGKSIHGFAIKAGLYLCSQVKNLFTSMYGKCAYLEEAERLFEEIHDKGAVSWNTMIGVFGQNGFFDEAMVVFKRMMVESVEPNPVTMITLLSANVNPETIHSHATKIGLINDFSVIASLVCEYARCLNSVSAELLYKSLPQKNLVPLTAIISSHAEKGNMDSVMELFSEMQQLGMKMDAVAMVSILHGIRKPSDFGIGLGFHGYGFKIGLSIDNLVANGLISMYSRFDALDAAFSVFFEMHEKPIISWNSLISGCVQVGKSSDAFELFCQMKTYGHSPDAITIASLMSGCGQLGYLQFGERLHNYVLRHDLQVEDFVETALIDMYTKCGRIEQAERVFQCIKKPCLATWNSMISGYSLFGLEYKALDCFSEMLEKGLSPDKISFLVILAACTHGGLIDEGRKYFQIMREEFNMVPSLQHFACMVGLFGRAGLFEEALTLIRSMEVEPDFAVWGALLNACCIHQEVELGEYVAKKLLMLGNKNGGFFVMMSNLYASKGRWDDVARVRGMMKGTGGDGCSGISAIEVTSLEGMHPNLSTNVTLDTYTKRSLVLY